MACTIVVRRGYIEFPKVSPSKLTLREFITSRFVPEVLASKPVTARRNFDYAINRHLLPALGEESIAAISFFTVQDQLVKTMVSRGYAPQTMKDVCRVLTRILVHARHAGYISGESPSAGIRFGRIQRKVARALTVTELRSVLHEFDEPWRTMALTSVTTSMNGAELRGLRWSHVNLTREPVALNGQNLPSGSIAVRATHAKGLYGTPRTEERARNVVLPDATIAALKRLRARTQFPQHGDLVFSTPRGKPLSVSFLHGRIKQVGNRVGLPWLSWQCFRNTYAALSEECGVPLGDRQAQLGLRSKWMVQHYGTSETNAQRRGSELIARRIS